MTCEVYMMVNRHGTKTKQWVLVSNGRAFPEILKNLEVADRMARLIFKETATNSRVRKVRLEDVWERAEQALVSEIAASLSVPKCPDGRWWNGAKEIGFHACVRCPHLKVDEDRPRGSSVQDFRISEKPAWECGLLIQEVRVARRLADR